MSITIDASVGGASSNSHVTEVEAIAYMATRLNNSTWTSVTGSTCTENEKKALIEATRELTDLRWKGRRADDTQILAWPRQWVLNPDAPTVGGATYYDSDVIPQRVKDATCELAFQYLKAGTTDVAAQIANDGVQSKTVGPISTTYFAPSQRHYGLDRYPRVLKRIAPMLDQTTGAIRLVRG